MSVGKAPAIATRFLELVERGFLQIVLNTRPERASFFIAPGNYLGMNACTEGEPEFLTCPKDLTIKKGDHLLGPLLKIYQKGKAKRSKGQRPVNNIKTKKTKENGPTRETPTKMSGRFALNH